jgi:hypothetical protein
VRTKRTKRTNSGKRAGPAIGDSVVRKICAVSAVCVVRGCVCTLVILIRGCRAVQSPYRPPPGHVASKKSALKALKASFLRAGLPVFPRRRRLCYKISPGESIALRLEPLIPVTNGTISLPTRYVLAIVPFVIRRPWSYGLGWPGLSGVVAFPKLSKLLNQEDALSAPCLQHFRNYCDAIKVARCGFP